jgi:hypothetical protein
MKHYRYVVLSCFGTSPDISLEPANPAGGLFQRAWYMDERYQDLVVLLAKGWRPVRETAMGGGGGTSGAAFSVIVVEKDSEDEAFPARGTIQLEPRSHS